MKASINNNNGSRCPMCGELKFGREGASESCALCGLGILDVRDAPSVRTPRGKVRYFCCKKCLKIYSMGEEKGGETDGS